MNRHHLLKERDAKGKPLRVGLIRFRREMEAELQPQVRAA